MLLLSYQGYTAETDFDWVRLCWVGKALNTEDPIDFQGATVDEAERNFHQALDAYLASYEAPELGLRRAG